MDAARVTALREALAGTPWPRAIRGFGGTLRGAVERGGGGLLLVGTPEYEPWHLAAHLDEEAAWSGLPGLSPTLVRHRVPPGAPAHLAVGVGRLRAAARGETLLVVAPDPVGAVALERLADAKRAGATLLTVDAAGDPELRGLSHEFLAVPSVPAPYAPPGTLALGLDAVQHLVSAAAAAPRKPLRARLSRLADRLSTPPPPPW
jgi:hypothetical protein